MRIKRLQLQGFRNLCKNTLEFSDHVNCIFGNNGSGKTNLLESISFLSSGKSFRKKSSFPQILNIDGEITEVLLYGLIEHSDERRTLSLKIDQEKFQWSVDGQSMSKRPNLIQTVFINPFDSYHFFNTSSFRRQWMDKKISLLREEYKKVLGRYNYFLKCKNRLLSFRPNKFREQIRSLNRDMASASIFLTQKRKTFLRELTPLVTKVFFEIFSEESRLDIALDSQVASLNEKEVFELFENMFKKDESVGYMKYGAHRDDYVLLFNGINASEFCSLGQQKIGFLGLIFAYIVLFKYKHNTLPIVLIDDVSGELDKVRWSNFIRYLKGSDFQTFITTANDSFKRELEKLENSKNIQIDDGLFV